MTSKARGRAQANFTIGKNLMKFLFVSLNLKKRKKKVNIVSLFYDR